MMQKVEVVCRDEHWRETWYSIGKRNNCRGFAFDIIEVRRFCLVCGFERGMIYCILVYILM